MEHRIGHPIYEEGDVVTFKLKLEDDVANEFTGTIWIVDANGTFEQNEEPSYDIMVENWLNTNQPCFVKHVNESSILKKES